MLKSKDKAKEFKYRGKRRALDGNTAVILCERESSDAAGAYPITPSTQMGEFWAEEASKGHINLSGRPLIFIEPESEHAAAAVTAGLSMTGLRATNFSSAQGVAFMHESLYAAVGKRLTYVLNIGCRAITKASLNVHCAHDDFHSIDDTGFFQLFAKSAQEAADLNMIAHKVAELALTPGVMAQDGFLTTHLIESLQVPERALIEEFLGKPEDIIETPTPAQRIIYGASRRRIPENWDVDKPVSTGSVQNQDAYMQAVAAQRPYFFDHIPELTDRAMKELGALTGRSYGRIGTYRIEDADYVILGMGSMLTTAEAVADYLRESRKIKVGVVNITMFRPFPGDLLGAVLKGKKGVAVLERTDQPLAEDLPIMRELRAALGKCLENGLWGNGTLPHPDYASIRANEMPRLYSGCFGLGSRDLQPEGIVGAIENMLPDGAHKNFFYLSVDFLHDKPDSPKQEIYMQELSEAYPRIRNLAVHGSENPNLMPKGAITVRMHSVGGWGAVTTGKNLAMTLFDLLGYDIKANPKYGSEKKGQPTTYYLAAAPEKIRVNAEFKYVDVVLSPDPNVFEHSNALAGLRKGGVFIIQSALESPEAVWRSFPITAQQYIVDNDIKVFYIDAFKIARDEATNPELQFRMQGIAFQGSFFAASGIMEQANLNEGSLFNAIKAQLESKFGSKGARVVEDNLRVVRRGFQELQQISGQAVVQLTAASLRRGTVIPVMLKRQAGSSEKVADIHRFWEQTGNFYISGKGNDNIVDPFIGLSIIPAASGVFRDMTQVRFEHPTWVAENCTACGECYTVCPDSAIPGLVSTLGDVFETTIRRVEGQGQTTRHLRRAVRTVEKKLRALVEAAGDAAKVNELIRTAINETVAESDLAAEEKNQLATEFDWFDHSLGEFKFAITKPYYGTLEKKAKGSGGLFSITVNPYTCKGCMECVDVCGDNALVVEKQTAESIERLRKDWQFWLDLPTTPAQFNRIDDLDERVGALHTMLLDKVNYGSMVCGDGACLGCGEKTSIHLFTATIHALMQPRVKKQVAKIESLIAQLEKHIRLKLAESMDLSDSAAIARVVDEHHDVDLTLSKLSGALDGGHANPLDADWLKWASGLLAQLKHLKWQYTQGVTNGGRSHMGIVNSTGCTSVWAATFPYSPYPFPWTTHLFQDSPSMAMGIFEGHMAKMAEGFKAIRIAELELAGQYNHDKHKDFFTYFDWQQFSDEEWLLCPPVVSLGGDGAMYDIGFQNLSRMMMSGKPIKVLVVDTQVYSNTGGQSCTSGYVGQVADMAPYAARTKGKSEIRKEMSLIAMAHRSTFVLQSSIAHVSHLLDGYIEGLNSRRPAIFTIYAVCPPEHGVGDDTAYGQSKMAVESRAYPLFRFNPDKGVTLGECADLDGNPAVDQDWPVYTINYTEDGAQKSMQLPFTFADFAVTEGRFRKHFKKAPQETWNDNMVRLDEFIEMDAGDRDGLFPFIWTVDGKGRLGRVLVSKEIVDSTIERRNYWRQLKGLVGADRPNVELIVNDARAEMAQRLTQALLTLAGGESVGNVASLLGVGGAASSLSQHIEVPALAAPAASAGANGNGAAAGYEAAWVESPECTSCDECIKIAPKVFAYNDKKQATVVNAKGAAFKDLVKAAENCTAGCIHPGTPWNSGEPNLDKLVKRAAKFH